MAQSTFNPVAGLGGALAEQIRNIGANPLIGSGSNSGSKYMIGASEYGQGESNFGSCRINSNSVYGFAELGPAPAIGHALGTLPCGTKLRIRNPANGREVTAEKIDIGAGGNPVEGLVRRIDLHYRTAQALGFSGTGKVEVEKINAAGQPEGGFKNISFSPLELLPPPLGPLAPGLPNPGKELLEGNIPNPLDPIEKFGDAFKKIYENLGAFFKFFQLISTPAGWLRIGKILLGAILLIIALAELAKIGSGSTSSSVPAKAAGLGTGVAKDAAIGAIL